MNPTFERLTFFTLGGIFVIFGYLLSGVNTRAAPEANITEFDTIFCKRLIVHDGTPWAEAEKISLGFSETGASELYLSSASEDGRDAGIYLSASEARTLLEMWGFPRGSGLISLRCSDTGAILQTSTFNRADEEVEFDEGRIEDDIKEDRSGVILEATPKRASLSIEARTVVSAERSQE